MPDDNDKSGAAERKPDPASELERFDREMRDATERGDQETAKRLFHERQQVIPLSDDLLELMRSMKRLERLRPVEVALRRAVEAGIGQDGADNWLAVEIIFAAIEFLEASPDLSTPLVTKKKIRGAHKLLVSVENRKVLILITKIRWAVEEGKSSGEWETAAKPLADECGKSAADLAERLKGHHISRKQGPIPDGKWTTSQIVEWLTGDPAKRKLASSALRRTREGRGGG